jgi:hypothetical protein
MVLTKCTLDTRPNPLNLVHSNATRLTGGATSLGCTPRANSRMHYSVGCLNIGPYYQQVVCLDASNVTRPGPNRKSGLRLCDTAMISMVHITGATAHDPAIQFNIPS